jgi:hypothetical protein
MQADDLMPNANPVQMKVCIFQGWEDDDNPEIIATFYTDPEGNVHVDNEAFYDTVRGIISRSSGQRTDGHDGNAFLYAVRAYFPGPHIWAGEVVPLFPPDKP